MRNMIHVLILSSFSCTQQASSEKKYIASDTLGIEIDNSYFQKLTFSENELHNLGLIKVHNPLQWESLSREHKPLYQVLLSNGNSEIYINYHAAKKLYESKKIILPTKAEADEIVNYLNRNLEDFSKFSKESTSFISFGGKFFDLQIANYWLKKDDLQNECSMNALSISLKEKRAYFSETVCQSAYPLKTFKSGL